METITRAGRGRPRKIVADAVDASESQANHSDDIGHREASGGGTGPQTINRREAEKRETNILTRMMCGDSFIVRK